MERKITVSEIPKTFADAVTVTRQLGYRYLWIDSLCIVQRDHEDWIAESVRMKDYYKGATVTICADSASGDHEGFLAHARNRKTVSFYLAAGEQVGYRVFLECPELRYGDTPLTRRAWTLQEFILSPLSLHWSERELIFECRARKYCESNANSQHDEYEDSIGSKRGFSRSITALDLQWYTVVCDYFFRGLTVGNDRLPAISALAREIGQQKPGPYVAGIWLENIHRGLLWTVDGAGAVLDSYRAPSWSWASLDSTTKAMPGSKNNVYGRIIEFQTAYPFTIYRVNE
jgi:hypothetical protein